MEMASVNLSNIGSDNGSSSVWHHAIIWTDAGLLFGPNFHRKKNIWKCFQNASILYQPQCVKFLQQPYVTSAVDSFPVAY